ncbi:MAG: flagellar biosynthesis anti-sigma factor FlgM [Legionella sp.]|nr:MAG: flagellar biosynthesis anti-sigma factor FlgM [Legionella sp.]
MSNVLEEPIMVSPINDLNKLKTVDGEHRSKISTTEKNNGLDVLSSLMDSVNLSTESKHLDALKASLRDSPEINEARVMYFKAEIEADRYEVNSDKIAKQLLNKVETV